MFWVALWQAGYAPVCAKLLSSTDVQCKAHPHIPPVASGMGAFRSTQQAQYMLPLRKSILHIQMCVLYHNFVVIGQIVSSLRTDWGLSL